MAHDIKRRKDGKLFDFGTDNKTFLRTAQDIHMVNTKLTNYYFMLEIYDPEVLTIDPYAVDANGNTTLTRDQITRVLTECARNPWYFLREIVRIPEQGGDYSKYKANRGNIAQAWCILHGIDSWLCIPRQQGKTMSALCIEVWAYIFGTTNSQFIQINKDGDNAKTNLRRMQDLIRGLPKYMQSEMLITADGEKLQGKNNATEIRNPVTNNSVIVKPKATSYDAALSIARGLTAPILHFDEPEFTQHIKTIVANSVSTYSTAAANAKKNHGMYARIFTCTPGDLATAPGQEAQEIIAKMAKWNEHMYDWSDDAIDEFFAKQGTDCNGIVYIEYDYHQLGKDENWFRELAAKINDPFTVRREILLQRLNASSDSPFSREDIEAIHQLCKNPIDELWVLEYHKFDIYKKLEKNIPYIIGVDCSSGTNGDNDAITILNPFTLCPDAEYASPYVGEVEYVNILKELCHILPKSVLVVERNSMGDAVIDMLLHSNANNRLYYDKNRDFMEEGAKVFTQVPTSMLAKHQAQQKKYYGVYTNAKSRDDMFAILARHVNEFKEKFVTKNITQDITELVRTSSGKIEARRGAHDDSVMSYLMCLYVYYHGNNLPLFGINPGISEESERHSGLARNIDDVDDTKINIDVINDIKDQEVKKEKSNSVLNYDDMLAMAIEKSQKETYDLYHSKKITDSIYDRSDNVVIHNTDDDGFIDLNIFNDLN